jgi:hypothetical protein
VCAYGLYAYVIICVGRCVSVCLFPRGCVSVSAWLCVCFRVAVCLLPRGCVSDLSVSVGVCPCVGVGRCVSVSVCVRVCVEC